MVRWGVLSGDEDQQGYIGLGIVVGTGLATAIYALAHASETSFGPGEALYVFTPVVVSIALVVAGTLLWTDGFDGPEMIRIGASVFLGMSVFGLLATWTITHQTIRGGSVAYAPFVTVNSMSVGGFVGLLFGWFDARNRRAERRLQRERNKFKQQTEELDQFAGIVSHDLRNPLNVATLNVQTAKADSESPETRESLTEVERSLDRMERIIDDVLGMVREGQTIDDLEPVQLRKVATYSWNNVDTNGATLTVESSARIKADRGALEHIFENLFRNSVEHGTPADCQDTDDDAETTGGDPTEETRNEKPVMNDGGGGCGVTVRVGMLDDGFYVEDTGTGIPSEIRATLFESGVTTNDDGTGLGLSIVDKLVTAHDWKIHATTGTDGGARFEITDVEFVNNPTADSWLSDLD
jgi:signal transduction histidine kinase